ncbi:hypothetical protein HGRIS_005036, partial [Hohenbuehelia grisea]
AVVGTIWALSFVASNIPPFERDFSHKDPTIKHQHKHSQISSNLNNFIAFFVPISIVAGVGIYRKSLIHVHHGLVAIAAARGFARLVTEFFKNFVGRLRPDFLSRCKWDKKLHECTGKIDKILDGRQSFPSGHVSAAFAGMTILSLWLAGQTGVWHFHSTSKSSTFNASRLARLALTVLPLFWATYVAITRLQDYRHHVEDVLAGGLVGIVSAIIFYRIFWQSPSEMADSEPRLLYTNDQTRPSRERFELARFEVDDTESV